MQGSNVDTAPRGRQPPCLSCQHLRKSCDADCVLAPYFLADQAQEFGVVTSVFELSAVIQMVGGVPEKRRRCLIDSLIDEAVCRLMCPSSPGWFQQAREKLRRAQEECEELEEALAAIILREQAPAGGA